jgi:hypothetical protein
VTGPEPVAIAVSHSWWALKLKATKPFAHDATRTEGHAQQIYARQLFGHLRALRRCAEMMAKELVRESVDASERDRLKRELEAFDVAAPSIKDARDVLEHFDEYARGAGKLARLAIQELGIDEYEAATMFSGGGYDPQAEKLTQGPFEIVVPVAIHAAERLQISIDTAGRAIDQASSTADHPQRPRAAEGLLRRPVVGRDHHAQVKLVRARCERPAALA